MNLADSHPKDIQPVLSPSAPPPAGPYSPAIAHGGLVYLSGQLPINPGSLKVEDPYDAVAQTHQILESITEILSQAGGALKDILKTTIFLTRIEDFSEVSRTYGSYFSSTPPARSCIVVSALPHPDALVEIEVTAALR